jgi:hypothetical protein
MDTDEFTLFWEENISYELKRMLWKCYRGYPDATYIKSKVHTRTWSLIDDGDDDDDENVCIRCKYQYCNYWTMRYVHIMFMNARLFARP